MHNYLDIKLDYVTAKKIYLASFSTQNWSEKDAAKELYYNAMSRLLSAASSILQDELFTARAHDKPQKLNAAIDFALNLIIPEGDIK